jgi:tight adherence protein C
MVILLFIVVALVFVAVVLLVSAVLEPRVRRSDNLAGIEAYGYVGRPDTPVRRRRDKRKTFDDFATSVGDLVARKVVSFREEEVQRDLIAAGFYRVGPRRYLGYRALLALALPIVAIWLLSLDGASALTVIFVAVVAFILGWVVPSFYVHRKGAKRLQRIDEALPGMIDLLVVTLEAGVGFNQALRMASDRLTGPLGQEIRLTIQEQSLGLSMLEALESWLRRCDTPSVRSFVRAMVQGDRLGVSIGNILRNQALEMRSRQKHMVEERAQKAPVKILFPLVFLIFPAMFVVILGPALFDISKALK